MHGFEVIVYDIAPNALEAAQAQVKTYAAQLVDQMRLTPSGSNAALARIRFTANPADADRADMDSESVPEDPALKAKVFAQFNQICPPHTIFTTNSSSLVPSMFAAATGRPAQFAALHFHSLVWDSNVVDANGVASPEDVDRAWMGVMKMPLGPFGWLDGIGLKTVWDITHYWAATTGDAQLQTNADFLKQYVDKNWLGVKTGKGFSTYTSSASCKCSGAPTLWPAPASWA